MLNKLFLKTKTQFREPLFTLSISNFSKNIHLPPNKNTNDNFKLKKELEKPKLTLNNEKI